MEFLSNILVQTSILAAALFVVVWVFVGKYLFKPFIAVLEEREQRTVGDAKRAREKKDEVKTLVAKLDEQLVSARLEGIRRRDKKITEAKTEAQDLVDRAAEQARESVESARLEIERIKKQALSDLSSEADQLSEAVVAKAKGLGAPRILH